MFWHGRSWMRSAKRELAHIEWLFSRRSQFAVTAIFGYQDDGRSVCLHLGIPWLAELYLVLPFGPRCRETKTGIQVHNNGLWFYPLTDENEHHADDPWYSKWYCWRFPWDMDWYSTEILKPLFGIPSAEWPIVWRESQPDRKRNPGISTFEVRKAREASVSETYDYTYTRKNGQTQNVQATIHVVRMQWRAKWWPIIRRKHVRTSIDIAFSAEIGEGVDDWKGGCVGCGWDMEEGETPLQCLKRMEKERRFDS